jgi:hypothetical protein
MEDHVYLRWLVSQNSEIIESLATACFVLGLALMHHESINEAEFMEYFKGEVRRYIAVTADVPVSAPQDEEEDHDEDNLLARMQRLHARRRGRRRKGPVSDSDNPLADILNEPPEPVNPIAKSHPAQLLGFMSYVHDIAAVAHPERPRFYPEMKELTTFTLNGLRSGFDAQVEGFEDDLRLAISLVDKGSELVLRVPKIDVATDADTGPRVDVECEADPDAEKQKVAPPGKGAKGAAPRKKGKA